MSEKIIIIDYGVGNLYSVSKAVAALGAEPVITSEEAVIAAAEKVILPGVGAFGDCMLNLEKSGLISVIRKHMADGKPLLGICVGLQILFEGSEEDPGVPGLGYFKGMVRKLTTKEKIPHMGWNQLVAAKDHPLLGAVADEYVYFVHSYASDPEDKTIITSTCDYGQTVVASVGRGNVQAVQFHPEKSSRAGLALLKAFKEWQP